MHEIVAALLDILDRGEEAVLCGIVESTGSAPRTTGAKMLVLADGSIRGTVGGGPVEGATLARARRMLECDEESVFLPFNLNSSSAADAGMLCGGAVKVLLQRIHPRQRAFVAQVLELFRARKQPALLTVMDSKGGVTWAAWSSFSGLCGVELPEILASEVGRKAAKSRQPFRVEEEGVVVFVEPVVSPTVLHVVGAGHVAQATSKIAAFAGFEVVVMDDRAEFANVARYPEARDVRVLDDFDACLSDLGADDFVVIVTRGHMHDRDVLAQALRTEAGYVGMIGSKSKRDAIYRSLLDNGFIQADLERVFCPIGVAIGADTPEEIAVSIVGELIKVRAERAL